MPETINILSNITNEWLIFTAAIALLISLFEAWLATLIVYAKVRFLKKIFPATHNLIRSHVDYTIMTALTGFCYFSVIHLAIDLPKAIIVILCFGVLYNPFGFVIKAINPNAGNSETLLGKIMVCSGFLPATIGFGYTMVAIINALL